MHSEGLNCIHFAFSKVLYTMEASVKSSAVDSDALMKNSSLYKEFLAEREEILRHKWLESEKLGQDIGFERALLDWIVRHRSHWKTGRSKAVKA